MPSLIRVTRFRMSHADVTLPRHLFRYEAHDEAMRVARGDELLLNRQYPTRQQIDIVLTHDASRSPKARKQRMYAACFESLGVSQIGRTDA